MPASFRKYAYLSFAERTGSPWAWSMLTYALPRWPLVLALAFGPALLLFALVALDPAGIGRHATSRDAVEATFARFISGLITAATIASSVAALTLGRELKGIKGQREHHWQNQEFRARTRATAGLPTVPLAIGPFIALQLEGVAAAAAMARARASQEDLAFRAEGATLGELLDVAEARARHVAANAARRHRPHGVLTAALDFEQELTHHLARRFSREDALPATVRWALETLAVRIEDVTVTTHYAKTLDIQWSLSRMSASILLTSLLAILAAAGTVLFYPEDMAARAGLAGAGAILAGTLGIALLPVTVSMGFLLRVVFINQHTLPSGDFLLGPEQPAVARGEVPDVRADRAG